jgi:uncharacterized protein YjiS (DUF1127 family)
MSGQALSGQSCELSWFRNVRVYKLAEKDVLRATRMPLQTVIISLYRRQNRQRLRLKLNRMSDHKANLHDTGQGRGKG